MRPVRRLLARWRLRGWLDLPLPRRLRLAYLADVNSPISAWEREAWSGIHVPIAAGVPTYEGDR